MSQSYEEEWEGPFIKGPVHGRAGGRTGGHTDRQTDGRMDGWMILGKNSPYGFTLLLLSTSSWPDYWEVGVSQIRRMLSMWPAFPHCC